MAEYKDITLITQEIEQGKKNLRFKNTEYAEIFSSALAFFQGVIDRVPAADVEPVKHGHWINENFYTRCSVCGKMAIYDKYGQEVESDYCPNCGAKMDGGEEND